MVLNEEVSYIVLNVSMPSNEPSGPVIASIITANCWNLWLREIWIEIIHPQWLLFVSLVRDEHPFLPSSSSLQEIGSQEHGADIGGWQINQAGNQELNKSFFDLIKAAALGMDSISTRCSWQTAEYAQLEDNWVYTKIWKMSYMRLGQWQANWAGTQHCKSFMSKGIWILADFCSSPFTHFKGKLCRLKQSWKVKNIRENLQIKKFCTCWS